ncbi:MAG: acetaldehyde dehydrogenase (acetylating) [Brevinema sp.]
MKKLSVAIIGTGNIGIDLLMKLKRSPILKCELFAGRNRDSEGIKKAESLGIPVSDQGIEAVLKSSCSIVFDATSAQAHITHAPLLEKAGKLAIDLTPAKIGSLCIPVLNLDMCLNASNINMVTCGGQAAVPIAKAITDIHPETSYIEIVSTIASKSAGMGTRENVDQFTQTTKEALASFSNVARTKSIILMNPAEPPIIMQNTIYALIEKPDLARIKESVTQMANQLKEYVPGYEIIVEPTFENGCLTTILKVSGSGDYLPVYAGNLDVITCAAVKVAEYYAQHKG